MNATFSGTELIPTRRSLLNRLKDWGDQAGWQEFFDTYWRLIYSVATKAGLSDTEAQEVVQETMLEVAKKMPGFNYEPEGGSFKGWLLQTTRWKVLNQFRRRQRERCEVQLTEEIDTANNRLERLPDSVSLDWDELWEAEWERNLFQAALEKVKLRVNPGQFEIFYLHVLKEQPVADVARALEVSASQVYVAKHRVEKLLRQEVQRLREIVG